MNTWVTLSDLGYVHRGRSKHRPRNAPELYGGPYPFVQTADIKHANLYLTGYEQTYSQVGLEQSRLWPAGTLCITIAANIADTAILGCDACFPDSVIGFIPDKEKCDVRYIKYLFDTQLQEAFQQLSQGVAQDNLSKDKLLSVKFPIPDLPTQRRIASILSAYDDLIETNRLRIARLEETARLTYCKWFGATEEIRATTLGEIAPFVRGKVITQKSAMPGNVPVVAGGLEPAYYHNAPNTGSPVITISASGANAGFTRMYFEPIWASDCSWCDQARAKWFFFAYCFLKDNAENLKNLQQGAAQPHVYPKDINALAITLPRLDNSLNKFESAVKPLFEQCGVLSKQNIALATARDMLLPRLMKGHVERNAE